MSIAFVVRRFRLRSRVVALSRHPERPSPTARSLKATPPDRRASSRARAAPGRAVYCNSRVRLDRPHPVGPAEPHRGSQAAHERRIIRRRQPQELWHMDYRSPRAVKEAVELLAAHDGAAHVLAGGTDLLVKLR